MNEGHPSYRHNHIMEPFKNKGKATSDAVSKKEVDKQTQK